MKRTYQPNNRHKHKTHGFLVRMRTQDGQNTLKRRRTKGRHRLAARTTR
ncbi:MAG: 50S ribosomal protein L34 [Chthonomonas sp.]|nr:50S ribosomal protein L34 [Chthonomonas sp.]